MCVSYSQSLIGCISSDRQFFFFENTYHHRSIYKTHTNVLQTGIWFLEGYKLWLTAGADYNLYPWSYNLSKNEFKQELPPLNAHLQQITGIVEIVQPKLLASCSLDGRIVLWDLLEGQAIAEIKDNAAVSRGVRGMTYEYEYGGNLITFGFEHYLNVWCPELSLTRSHVGKLEGHSSIIVACRFIPLSPNVISIDDKSNIRIWDIRVMSPI